ncbi:DUF5666 domain-containing protein [Methylobacillus gramineus]|uniref:DUF5666 domain-containing protein n=1 Tax=Methylobacillus gramineus TaxID=755169 RepID=UPI001CFF65D9|nr:DUF5666 domain-containing protein [Methylobacillus gramineus]MCB5185830.1 DUF5666 domain-containing protein [Methylobacillus gramineus]
MKKTLLAICCAGVLSGLSLGAQAADEEFYGVIESRPQENVGTWVIGGRKLNVTKDTELENDHGPLVKGACVEVEIEDGLVQEIETKKKEKCAK